LAPKGIGFLGIYKKIFLSDQKIIFIEKLLEFLEPTARPTPAPNQFESLAPKILAIFLLVKKLSN
jgi:hypothetical protein